MISPQTVAFFPPQLVPGLNHGLPVKPFGLGHGIESLVVILGVSKIMILKDFLPHPEQILRHAHQKKVWVIWVRADKRFWLTGMAFNWHLGHPSSTGSGYS